MQTAFNGITEALVQLLVVIIGYATVIVANQLKSRLSSARKKDETGIVDFITDRVVEFAEAELSGSDGRQKLNWAVDKATSILESKGIEVNHDEVVAGIENGVNKLKLLQQSTSVESPVTPKVDGLSQITANTVSPQ